MDLYPTILNLVGISDAAGHTLDGFDLKSQLAGKHNDVRIESFLSHFPHEHHSQYFSSLVLGDWKVVYFYLPGDSSRVATADPEDGGPDKNTKNKTDASNVSTTPYALFDLKHDPFETSNLADKHPEKLKEMMAALVKDLEDKHALYPEKNGQPIKPKMPG